MRKDIDSDMVCYSSNIPLGFGLGSSGSLTAAIYYHYTTDNTKESIEQVRLKLSKIEAFFHGVSSGIDPLVSYFNKPIYSSNSIASFTKSKINTEDIFLIDSGISRSTKPLVENFKKKLKKESFKKAVTEIWINASTQAIDDILNGNRSNLQSLWRAISEFQFKYMSDFIPENISPIWEDGLITSDFNIKLCGAGGGGVFLAFGSQDRFNDKYPFLNTHNL